MRTRMKRLALMGGATGCLMAMGPVAPANAAGNTQISGGAYYDDAAGTECGVAPAGFADYPALVLHGDLEGCLFTDAVTSKDSPSGVYQETGREYIVASLNGGPVGTFTTNYRFEGKYDPDVFTGVEVKGRCQHPLVAGSGTGSFSGATGRLDFKDDVENAIFYYRGHIKLG